MKFTTAALSVLLTTGVLAVPQPQQLTFNPTAALSDASQAILDSTTHLFDSAQPILDRFGKKVDKWVSTGVREFEQVSTNGILYELITHADFPEYSIRLKEPTLCDSSVRSYSGYLDIGPDVHLFFWAFESRRNPSVDPLVMWLNGGPGCSSTTGLLFELGPCSIANEGKNTTFNPHSWNSQANMIFLDQPVQVGYSYGGKTVNSSPESAKDVYAFMQLFYAKFPKFAELDFHVAAESYGGTYVPNIATEIHKNNLKPPTENAITIPLVSILIGNGLTDAYTQFAEIPTHSCAPSEYALFDEATCDEMRAKVPRCQQLTKFCYNAPNRFTCVPATMSCWQIAAPFQNSGRNPYDVRKTCDREGEDGPLCYKEMGWIETYLNKPEIKEQLGVAESVEFESCNMKINQAFMFNGDVAHNTAALLPPLLESGIRVLIYAGMTDSMCNWIGNRKMTLKLEWSGQEAFNLAEDKNYTTTANPNVAGKTISVGEGAGLLTYLQIYDSGHMVPFDTPEVALDFFKKWLSNEPLA